jgi:L-serine dehydratase
MLAALEFRNFAEARLTASTNSLDKKFSILKSNEQSRKHAKHSAKANEHRELSGQDLSIEVELYGSLSATGHGHATDGAVCAGLAKLHPRSAEPEDIWAVMPAMEAAGRLDFADSSIAFKPSRDIKWLGWTMDDGPLPHPNTIRFRLLSKSQVWFEQTYFSVGGGFVETADPTTGQRRSAATAESLKVVPYPFDSAAEFVEQCRKNNLSPWQLVVANEEARGRKEDDLRDKLSNILRIFDQCIDNGLKHEGILPGGLNVRRRAKSLFERMKEGKTLSWSDGGDLRPSIYAMAVNEENAAGGRVVTAPTNGSSGLIPAVWRTLKETKGLSQETLQNGLLVASVVGALVKTHASISGAEVGCQGEVGTSCAMAAAGATAMLGGNVNQIEQAAEIGIEHHLGMTCDPIMGLVQVPCIERNAMGAVKALNAACLALACDGSHLVSLDKALEVMKQTGLDMHQKYKETSTGGLALG